MESSVGLGGRQQTRSILLSSGVTSVAVVTTVEELYQRFAIVEARGVSPTYEQWAENIAADRAVAGLIAVLPPIKRQPNLVFAAARWVGAPVGPYPKFRSWLLEHWADVVPVVMSRATQTNEAGRCAVLLPQLGRIAGPLSLIEVGASAGLCLYPDRYSYRYDTGSRVISLDPAAGPSQVRLPCRIEPTAVPKTLPHIVYRAGVDLNPLDVRAEADLGWLQMLIWPEHDQRRARLHAAAAIAAAEPVDLVKGDLVEVLPRLVQAAPAGSRVVVFHTAVLAYLQRDRRKLFVDLVSGMPNVTWLSNEGAGVLPGNAGRLDAATDRRMVLARDGEPVARTDPHGQSYETLGDRL